MTLLRHVLIAMCFGLATASVPATFSATSVLAAPAKKNAKTVKGKAKAKAKPKAKTKAKAPVTAKATPKTKAKAKTKATPATTKATAPTKATTKAQGTSPVKATAKGKAKAKTKAVATGKPAAAPVQSVQPEAYDDAESGPWLFLFVGFIAASVGLLVYLRKKRLAGAAKPQGADGLHHSRPETAFGSALSSLDLTKSKGAQPLSTKAPTSRVG